MLPRVCKSRGQRNLNDSQDKYLLTRYEFMHKECKAYRQAPSVRSFLRWIPIQLQLRLRKEAVPGARRPECSSEAGRLYVPRRKCRRFYIVKAREPVQRRATSYEHRRHSDQYTQREDFPRLTSKMWQYQVRSKEQRVRLQVNNQRSRRRCIRYNGPQCSYKGVQYQCLTSM